MADVFRKTDLTRREQERRCFRRLRLQFGMLLKIGSAWTGLLLSTSAVAQTAAVPIILKCTFTRGGSDLESGLIAELAEEENSLIALFKITDTKFLSYKKRGDSGVSWTDRCLYLDGLGKIGNIDNGVTFCDLDATKFEANAGLDGMRATLTIDRQAGTLVYVERSPGDKLFPASRRSVTGSCERGIEPPPPPPPPPPSPPAPTKF